MVRGVDAGPRVNVVAPDTADARAALDDVVIDAESVEANTHDDAACSGTHDEHGWPLGLCGPLDVAREESHFFAHHRRVFGGDEFAKAHAHHLDHQFVTGVRNGRLEGDGMNGGSTDFVGDVVTETGVLRCDQSDVAPREVRGLEPLLVAGDLEQTHGQHPEVGIAHRVSNVHCGPACIVTAWPRVHRRSELHSSCTRPALVLHSSCTCPAFAWMDG